MNRPITSMLGRLLLWQKLMVLGIIAVILVAIPFTLFFQGQQQIIDVALSEQRGLEPAAKAINLLRATAQHRGLVANALAGKDGPDADWQQQRQAVDEAIAAFDAIYQPLNYPGLPESWSRFKADWAALTQGIANHTLSREQSLDAHAKLDAQAIGLVTQIADGSLMSLDPDSESYYIIQAVLTSSPMLLEKLGQARDLGVSLLHKSGGTGKDDNQALNALSRAAVYNYSERANESLNNLAQQLGELRQASAEVRNALNGAKAKLDAPVQKALPMARTEIVEASVLNHPAADYFSAFTQAMNAVGAFTEVGIGALNQQLGDKVAEAQATLWKTTAFILLVFVAAALIAYLVSRSITVPVGHLVGVMDKLAKGDSNVRARLESSDEIGALARQFDLMVDEREAVSQQIKQENENLNNSVIGLMQAVAKLSEKDLTVKVPVAEDITGLVADALNLLAQETANALNRVSSIAGHVAQVSQRVKAQSDTVIDVAAEEKREVEQATVELSHAAEVMQDIAKLALSCNQAAEKAIETTNRAQETVLGTVEGITTIRDTIRETEKRIKRLGERSQEIGGVVNLINGIAERTHILAINASMHAASAGEAGRGFAVVANEVQKLAENAREATQKIASLVNNIQLETADTVTTMNDAISQVVKGTSLAQQAGNEMRETRDTTASLVQLVQRIATNSATQAQTSEQLRERAMQIQKSTEITYQQLREQGTQTERLVGFSDELVETVGVFTLPKMATA